MGEQAYIDNGPNKAELATFDMYRHLCDEQSGLMRIGVTLPEIYEAIASDPGTEFGTIDGNTVPIVASVDPFHIPEDGSKPESTADKSALVPLELVPGDLQQDLVVTQQFLLGQDDVNKIITPPEGTKIRPGNVPELFVGKAQGELIQGHGEPQFTVLSEYDVSGCDTLRETAPQDILTRGGHTITTSKEKILADLPRLAKLHEDIFKRQATRIGYYDGLVGDIIERFLRDDAFVGAAAYDKDDGEPFMFAIFAIGLDGLDQMPWLNKQRAQEATEGANPTFAMPIAITAKFHGMGVFAETTSVALHEILYRTQEQTKLYALYNANLQSVGYTPRIINAATEEDGAHLLGSIIEASVVTRI
ncbi:MAG TPA: hypothetical protein VK674_06140 [Candidatus Limnocylindria bacterium]|nr:hypothetical protein [Candidatus Limnocylindria bacterium]